MAYVDFKITAWERVHIKDEVVKEVTQKIIEGAIKNSDDLLEEFEGSEAEIVYETSQQMSLEDNDNESTIEVFDKLGRFIINNTNNQTVKTIKSFHTVEEILEYCVKIECTFTVGEIVEEIERHALVKYGSILILFDPYCLLD